MINWKQMGVVLEEIDRLNGLVNMHNAGMFAQGTVVRLLHTLN